MSSSNSKDYINDPDFIADLAVAQISFLVANTAAVVGSAVAQRHGQESLEVQRERYNLGIRQIVRNIVGEMSLVSANEDAMTRMVAMGHQIAEERAAADA